MANLPEGWTIDGSKAVGRFGERHETRAMKGGVMVGTGRFYWPLEITLDIDPDGNLTVNVADENESYTSGSFTNVEIPAAVLVALISVNK